MDENIENKSNVTEIDLPDNGKDYLIGTAHVSLQSQEEVAVNSVINNVGGNCTLCTIKLNLLHFF